MLGRVVGWLAARLGAGEKRDADGESGGFAPSPLDRSVREAHGGSDDGEHELAEMRERAESLEREGRNG